MLSPPNSTNVFNITTVLFSYRNSVANFEPCMSSPLTFQCPVPYIGSVCILFPLCVISFCLFILFALYLYEGIPCIFVLFAFVFTVSTCILSLSMAHFIGSSFESYWPHRIGFGRG